MNTTNMWAGSSKTSGEIRERANALAVKVGLVAAVIAVAFIVWTGIMQGQLAVWILGGLAALAFVGALAAAKLDRDGWAFIGSALAIVGVVAMLFVGLFPDVMPSTINEAYNLTVENASSTPYTLKIMTWVAVVFTPIVILYQSWTYWVFSKRISVKNIPDDVSA